MEVKASLASADPVVLAHDRLLHDRSIQFTFDAVRQPEPPPPWLTALFKAIDKALQDAGPWVTIGLWGLLAILVVLVLVVIGRELLTPPGGRKERPADLSRADAWRPSVARARALLEEADHLAEQGLFSEAVHVLLFRSIDDVEGRRPDLIAPSLTSRDIAALDALPPGPRDAFAHIAAVVEAAIFGGRPVDAHRWSGCREAYGRFAFPDAWTTRP